MPLETFYWDLYEYTDGSGVPSDPGRHTMGLLNSEYNNFVLWSGDASFDFFRFRNELIKGALPNVPPHRLHSIAAELDLFNNVDNGYYIDTVAAGASVHVVLEGDLGDWQSNSFFPDGYDEPASHTDSFTAPFYNVAAADLSSVEYMRFHGLSGVDSLIVMQVDRIRIKVELGPDRSDALMIV